MMTAELRQECLSSGWPPDVVNRLQIKFSDGKFVGDIPEDIKSRVGDLNFGTPSTQPNRAFHRYGNRTSNAESFMLKRAKQLMGGK